MHPLYLLFCFKQKTAYESGTGDWSSDVCSSDLVVMNGASRWLDANAGTLTVAAIATAKAVFDSDILKSPRVGTLMKS